jgi:hypothetical protein
MLFSTIAICLLAALPIASAGPPSWHNFGGPGKKCLSPQQVQSLLDGYSYLLQFPGGPNFTPTANNILTPDFQVFSDSILTLSNRPVRTSHRHFSTLTIANLRLA